MTHLQRQVIDAAVELSRDRLAAGETANLTADELARHLGRAVRPVGGCCSALTRAGYLERVAAATYRLTTPGLSALRQQPGYAAGARILVARDHDGRIPAEAQVTAKDPSRPHLIRVVYAESRRGAWIARDRILGPAPAPAPAAADDTASPTIAEALGDAARRATGAQVRVPAGDEPVLTVTGHDAARAVAEQPARNTSEDPA
jgi:hypothetical protein